ncbi:helix-turn-helix domain-containing protein [Streptomyces sp. Ru62]|nr:helix-turn-helix domain-containing protein [Streptomyces sp. Ru62]
MREVQGSPARRGHGGLPWQGPEPPARPEEPVGPSRYLTEADRIHIADRLREKPSVRAIAAELAAAPPP